MNLFAFGLGYTARDFLARHGAMFESIAGTVRSYYAAECLDNPRIQALVFDSERADPAIAEALAQADVVLISIPPGVSVDPVLTKFGRQLAAPDRPRTILYLSTIGVYGDRGGEWVDETRIPMPKHERSIARSRAEKAWLALAKDERTTVHILRLAGIYGPRRNALTALHERTARRIVKEGQVFNRIHVADISATLAALLAYRGGGEIWNVADDEPAPPQDVIAYAAKLMGIVPPPELDIEMAELSALARSFYDENKRASNRKLKETLGVKLRFPTYREGLAALWEAGEGRG
ncbi:MAG: SDR family oxidoreductase [Methylovirgula sp.]